MKGLIRLLQSQPIFAIDPIVGMQMLTYVLHQIKEKGTIDPDILGVSQPNVMDDIMAAYELIGENNQLKRARYKEDVEDSDPAKTVFVYPIHGAMMTDDQFCGPVGMNTMAVHMRELAHDKNVGAVVIDYQTPGGSVLGLEELGAGIDYLKQHKPVVSYLRGVTASAGYKMAALGHHVMAGGKGTKVGSIGTMMAYMDFTEFLKNNGVQEIKIMSSLSPDKNKYNLNLPSDDDVKLIQDEVLDPLSIQFHDAVREARPGVNESVFTGDMYFAQEAQELGLIDSIGTYQAAVLKAASLIETNKGKRTMLGLKNKNTEKATKQAAQTQIEKLQQEHATELDQLKQIHADALETLKATHADQVSDLTSQIDQLAKSVSTLSEKVDTLSAAPVNKVKDPEGNEGPAKEALEGQPEFAYGGFGEERRKQFKEEMGGQ